MKARVVTLLTKLRGYLLFRVGVLAMLTMLLLLTLVCTSAAWATTFTVTNTNDSGRGSLRAAIAQANANAGADEIVFADGVNGTIFSTLPTVTDAAGLTIDGGGDVRVDAAAVFSSVFRIQSGAKLTLRNLTVGPADSSGIQNQGMLTVINVELFGNTNTTPEFEPLPGGAISNSGTLTVTNSYFSSNGRFQGVSEGGGIYNTGKATITNSTFSENHSAFGGAGISNSGTLAVTNSTFFHNDGEFGSGGAISNVGTLTVTSSTFSRNMASLGVAAY